MKTGPTRGSALGTSLLALGAALLALALLWEVSLVARGVWPITTLIFGLGLTVVLTAPLIGAGWYLRGRGVQEATEASQFGERRAVLDADAALRREVVREIDQQLQDARAALPMLPQPAAASLEQTARLLAGVRDDLALPGYSSTTWMDSGAGLRPEQIATVRRYDDLVVAQARRLGEIAGRLRADPAAVDSLARGAQLLAEHVAEREALLGRGQEAPAMRPQEMLDAGVVPRRRLEDPVRLALEDAVSYEGIDYVVRGVLDYFAGGRRWRSYQLHDGKEERWLEVRGNGSDLFWFQRVTDGDLPASTGDSITWNTTDYRLDDQGAASISLETAAGRQDGALVEFRRYRAGIELYVTERWPDGPRVLTGSPLARENLDLWTKPAAPE